MLEAVIPGDYALQNRNNRKIPEEKVTELIFQRSLELYKLILNIFAFWNLNHPSHRHSVIKRSFSVLFLFYFFSAESILLLWVFLRSLFIFIAPKSQNLVDNSNNAMFCISFKVKNAIFGNNGSGTLLIQPFLIIFTASFYE